MIGKNTLGVKISLGFLLILAIMLVIVIFAISGLKSGSADFKQYRALAEESVLSGRVQANMLLASRAAGRFLKTRNEKYYETFLSRIEQARQVAIEQQEVMDERQRKKLSIELIDTLDSYGAVAVNVFGLMRNRDSILEQRLAPQGIRMRTYLGKIMEASANNKDVKTTFNVANALKSVLLGRLYVLKFLDKNTGVNVDRVRTELGVGFESKYLNVENSIKGARNKKLLNDFAGARTIYMDAFNEMVATINARNLLINEKMQPMDKRIAYLTEKITLSIKESQNTLGHRVQTSNEFSVHATILTSIIALILAAFIVFFIVRALTKPIQSLVKVVEAVQKSGDLNLRNINDSEDEIGSISDAFNGFLDSLQLKMLVAKDVAKGILSTEVEVLSDQDIFGKSIQTMVVKLRDKEKALTAISLGDLSVNVDMESREDRLAVTINRMITDMREVAKKADIIASGDYRVELLPRSDQDTLMQALFRMITAMREIAKKADIIASGDYGVELLPRSDQDTLMQALNRMTNTLQDNATQSEHISWQKTGVNFINNEIRGNLTEAQLAKQAVSAICKHTDMQGGVYYGYDPTSDLLEFKGGYALDLATTEFENIRKGQGLAGQVVVDLLPVVVRDLPSDFYNIQTLSGNTPARNAFIFPLIYDQKLLAILEFVSTGEISLEQQEFMNFIDESICIGILSARQQKKAKDLLEQTQEQATELKLRQQELKKQGEATQALEVWYRGIVSAAPSAILIVDIDGKIKLCNPQAEKIFGYDVMELVGESVEILVPLKSREGHDIKRSLFLQEGEERIMGGGMDKDGLRKDGSVFPVEVALSQLPELGGGAQVFVSRCMTYRKESLLS